MAITIGGKTCRRRMCILIGRGALFHDLGKSKTRPIEHGKNDSTLKRDLDYHREIQAMMDNS